MSAQIVPFTFQQHYPVRVILVEDDPWFCLHDVCKVLEVDRSSNLIKNLDKKGWAKNLTPTQGGEQEVIFINEPNLYRVIFRSNKPEAKAFQDWVFNEVLPAIRKHGRYETADAPPPSLPIREPISPAKYQQLQALVRHIGAHCHAHGKAQGAVWTRLRHDYDADSVLRLPVESFDAAHVLLTDLLSQSRAYFKDQMRREDIFINEVIRRGARLQLVLSLLPTPPH